MKKLLLLLSSAAVCAVECYISPTMALNGFSLATLTVTVSDTPIQERRESYFGCGPCPCYHEQRRVEDSTSLFENSRELFGFLFGASRASYESDRSRACTHYNMVLLDFNEALGATAGKGVPSQLISTAPAQRRRRCYRISTYASLSSSALGTGLTIQTEAGGKKKTPDQRKSKR